MVVEETVWRFLVHLEFRFDTLVDSGTVHFLGEIEGDELVSRAVQEQGGAGWLGGTGFRA